MLQDFLNYFTPQQNTGFSPSPAGQFPTLADLIAQRLSQPLAQPSAMAPQGAPLAGLTPWAGASPQRVAENFAVSIPPGWSHLPNVGVPDLNNPNVDLNGVAILSPAEQAVRDAGADAHRRAWIGGGMPINKPY